MVLNMFSEKSKVSGIAVASKGDAIDVKFDISLMILARTLARALVMLNDTVLKLLEMQDLIECFAYALEVSISQGTDLKKASYEVVPKFLSDITMSLKLRERGVVIHVNEVAVRQRPNSYDAFLDVLGSIGIPTDKVLRINPESTSRVLAIGITEMNGTDTLVGIDKDVSIEELVVRSLLTVAEEQQAKLTRVIGHMDRMYVSRDELLRQWGTSVMGAKLA